MSAAFKCDRCEKLFSGHGWKSASSEISWLPKQHSYLTDVKVEITKFRPANGRKYTFPLDSVSLCKGCIIDVLFLFLNKRFGTELKPMVERLDVS